MTDLSKNPLLNPPALPNGAPALDAVKTEHFLPAVEAAIAEARAEIDAIKTNADAPTFANTIEALEEAGQTLDRVAGVFYAFTSGKADDALRAVEKPFKTLTVRYSNDISLDPVLFERVKAVYDNRAAFNLTPLQLRLLEDKYKNFVRGGALLDDAGKTRLREVNEKLSNLQTQYGQNVMKSTAAYEKIISDEAELAGLPQRVKDNYKAAAEDAIKQAQEEHEAALAAVIHAAGASDEAVAEAKKAVAEAKKKLDEAPAKYTGKWLIQLSPPPLDIITHAENRSLREEIARARANIAYKDEFDNSQIALDIVRYRHERANLLGFDTHADFVLAERMAKDRKTVEGFLQTNKSAYRAAAELHKKAVEDFAKKKGLTDDLKPWDFGFYERMLQEETYSVDVEALRPYFELNRVLKGMFDHAEKLFGIRVEVQPDGKYPVFDPEMKVYEIFDKPTGTLLGVFYTDFYARVGAKSPGAWMSGFRERAGDQIPLVTNTCNYEKPGNGGPVLLSFDQVTTMFHEFGHGLHGLLAQGPYASLNGTNVQWDAVEFPSQVQENWARAFEVLSTFAVHHKTGEALPADLVKKLIEMENFGAGYMGLRQTFLGLLDMAYHAVDPATLTSIEDVEDKIVAEAALFPRVSGTISSSFSHIFKGGYSAGYYSYKWAEVLDADVYAAFEKSGDLYNPDLAAKLRKFYESGNTADPAILFKNLMGRDPDATALFHREGLKPPKPNGQGPRPPVL